MVVLIKLKFNTRGGGGAGAREVRYRLTVMDTKLRNLGMKLMGFWGQGVKSSHNS